MHEVTVHSWAELNERLFSNSWQEPLKRFRATSVYRGQGNIDDRLVTSLYRLGGERAADIEDPLLRAFHRYSHPYQPDRKHGFWDTLALAQHHGLPTRLLDWSYSPLVALHFATESDAFASKDGAVWAVNFCRSNDRLPERLQKLLQNEGTSFFFVELLESVARDLATFDALSPEPFLAFFEPPSIDDRIVNQFALFSLLSSPTGSIHDWLHQANDDMVTCIRIPVGLKAEVRDKLDQANVTERVLFPGLDGLARWLKRYYTPQ